MEKTLKTKTKIIVIDGMEIPMRISAATIIFYKNEFHKDMFKNLSKLTEGEVNYDENGNAVSATIPEEAVETILEVGYIMAKQGDSKMKKSFVEWLDQFSFESITDSALAEIMSMIQGDQETMEEPKKNNEEQSAE